ncbi:YccF domain-containing protein [Marinifilum fragile]|uniref:YccF domain-containing protein n=1 Tax=Marinifilum fragile TaxID=570161 RepID=UPI002AA75404|nr:YccF domain-containing protein [Marinifilum fragile]
MRFLGNIIWHFPFFGFVSAFFTFLIGSLLLITVVGAPIGLGLIQLSKFLLSPFSSSMVDNKELNTEPNKAWEAFGLIVRIIYFPFGLLLTVITLFQIVGLFVSVVGIPVALVLAKSLSTYLNPVNKKCVPVAVAKELENRKAKAQVDAMLG